MFCLPSQSLKPGAIDALLEVASRWPRAGVLGPQILTPEGLVYPSARELPSLGRGIGHALFGWLNSEDWQTSNPHAPDGPVEAVSARISAIAGRPRHSLSLYAFALALLVAPLARGHALRAILFALLAMALAWIQMAVTANAGGSVHHAILLWPFPEMVIAVSFAAASRTLPIHL